MLNQLPQGGNAIPPMSGLRVPLPANWTPFTANHRQYLEPGSPHAGEFWPPIGLTEMRHGVLI